MALPRQRGEHAKRIRPAGGDAEIALDAENGDDDLARHAMALIGAGERRLILRRDRAAAGDAAIGHGAAEIGGNGDCKLGLRFWLRQNGGFRLEAGGRRLEGLARHSGGLRLRPQTLHECLEIRCVGRRFGQEDRQSGERQKTQRFATAGMRGGPKWRRGKARHQSESPAMCLFGKFTPSAILFDRGGTLPSTVSTHLYDF